MDISVTVCSDFDFIQQVLLDDWAASSNDGCTIDDVVFDDRSLWLEMQAGNQRIGCWKLEARTNVAIVIHCNILKQFRRKYWANCAQPMIEFVKQSPFKKLLIEIPKTRKRAQMGAAHNGFKREAILKDAIIEDGELTDIYVYSRSI